MSKKVFFNQIIETTLRQYERYESDVKSIKL